MRQLFSKAKAKAREVWHRMSEAWTENNDGKNLPDNMDASQHSGYENIPSTDHPHVIDISSDHIPGTEDVDGVIEHFHKWKRGILPGNVYMKSCKTCGETVKPIAFDEWITLA